MTGSYFGRRNPDVFKFLSEIRAQIEAGFPPVNNCIDEIETEAIKGSPSFQAGKVSKVSFQEGALVSRYVVPSVHSFLVENCKFSKEEAARNILSENRLDKERGFARKDAITAYPLPHPFTKSLGIKAADLSAKWYGVGKPLSTRHPDFCIKKPYPILFEVKYFRKGGRSAARRALTSIIYEAFFYLGLAVNKDVDPPWDYEFACALAFDATPEGFMKSAWEDMHSDLRDFLWNAANIFVMLLRSPDAK